MKSSPRVAEEGEVEKEKEFVLREKMEGSRDGKKDFGFLSEKERGNSPDSFFSVSLCQH